MANKKKYAGFRSSGIVIDPIKIDPERDLDHVELKSTTLPPVKIDVKSGKKSAMDVAKDAQDNLNERMSDPEEGIRFIDGKPENALPKFSYEEVQLDAKDDPEYEDIKNMKRNALKAIANVRKWKGPLESGDVSARKK